MKSDSVYAENSYFPVEWWQQPYYPTTYAWTTSSPSRCAYCDGFGHPSKPEVCPRVKSIEYFENGNISKIKFHKEEV